jgi:hypothetical protein
MTRRTAVAERAREGLLMPAGPVIAGIWDQERGRYVALSKAFIVKAGIAVEAPLERPRENRAALIVQARRSRLASTRSDYSLAIRLKADNRERQPDALAQTANLIYAIWHGLPPGTASLSITTPRAGVNAFPLHLQGGRIERVLLDLEPLPELPPGLR